MTGWKAPSTLKVVPWPAEFAQPYLVNVTGIKTPTSGKQGEGEEEEKSADEGEEEKQVEERREEARSK